MSQLPLAHCPFPLHDWPLASLQLPSPLHAFGATQVPGSSSWSGTLTQLPTCPNRLHVSHVSRHDDVQQTLSAQKFPEQSSGSPHVSPAPQRVAHEAGSPPQSTSVSVPFIVAVSQLSMPPQPSETMPQVAPSEAQVPGVQPHTSGTPPPPQVSGALQFPSAKQPTQLPFTSHTEPPLWLHVAPGAFSGFTGSPFSQMSSVQSSPSMMGSHTGVDPPVPVLPVPVLPVPVLPVPVLPVPVLPVPVAPEPPVEVWRTGDGHQCSQRRKPEPAPRHRRTHETSHAMHG